MDEDEPIRGAHWVTWTLCNLCMLGFAIILIAMGLAWLRDLGGWSLIKKANNGAGNLLTASVAFLALWVAYREYLARNSPLFTPKIHAEHGNVAGIYYDVTITSHFDKVIHLESSLGNSCSADFRLLFQKQKEILEPGRAITVARLYVSHESLAKASQEFLIRCIGRSAVTPGATSNLTVKCTIPQQADSHGCYQLPHIDYNFEPDLGLLSIFK